MSPGGDGRAGVPCFKRGCRLQRDQRRGPLHLAILVATLPWQPRAELVRTGNGDFPEANCVPNNNEEQEHRFRYTCSGFSIVGIKFFQAKVGFASFRIGVKPAQPERLNLVLSVGKRHYSEVNGNVATLICFMENVTDVVHMVAITGSYRGFVKLEVTIENLGEEEQETAPPRNMSEEGLHIEGEEAPSILSFAMDAAPKVQRFVFEAKDDGDDTVTAHVFPVAHRCASKIHEVGCVTASNLLDCLSSYAFSLDTPGASNSGKTELMPAHTLTISRKATLTLSRASYPSIDNTTWFVVATCTNGHANCNRSMTMKVKQDDSTDAALARGVLMMFVVPILFLVMMLYIRELLIRFAAWSENSGRASTRPGWRETFREIVSNGRREVVGFCTSTSTRRHGKMLLLLASAYFTSTIQFVMTRWSSMIRTGNRDICYFNEACFLPFMIWDAPFNKFVSHIPYFVCSGFVFVAILNAEAKWRKLFVPGVITPLDLSVFYALCLVMALEGFGSLCYHLCPGLEVFQFDTAFMIPMAHLCMFALLEEAPTQPVESTGLGMSMVEMSQRSVGRFPAQASTAGENENDETFGSFGMERSESGPSMLSHHHERIPAPYQYFLCVVCPMWMFNFLGSWFDVDLIRHGRRYVACLIVMGLWASWIVGYLPLFFPESASVWPARALQLFLLGSLLAALVSQEVRQNIGGTANVLLLLSIVAMFWVTLAQLCVLDLGLSVVKLSSQSRRSIQAGMVLKGILTTVLKFMSRYFLEGVFLVVGVIAVKAFTAHATDVLALPAKSRNLNAHCFFGGAFDTHDLWHMLSAIALSLWVLGLLHARLRIWMRVWQCGNSFLA